MPGAAPPVAPSGAQFEIAHGEQRAVVVEVGGGLRAYTAGEHAVLDGYAPEEMCSGGRGQLLIPWPNRVAGGRWKHGGAAQQLAVTEVPAGNAIHGLVRWAGWSAAEHGPDHVTMVHRLHPQPGWPGALDLRAEYRLGGDGLTVTVTALNAGSEPCPYGVGAHPYLTVGTPSVDDVILELPAATRLATDEHGIPTGALPVAGTPDDFTVPRAVGTQRLDTGYTDLRRDADGCARARIATADGARRTTLWVDDAHTHLMVFTGDTLAAPTRRRGIAIEPMSCPPNALVTGEGLVWLSPGEDHVASWGISPG